MKALTALGCFFIGLSTVQAGELADKVQATYRNIETFEADFTQKTYVEILEKDVVEKGDLVFAKPDRFLVRYQGSKERQYISDGKTLWVYRPKDKEVEVTHHVEDVVSPEALVFLGGLGDMTKTFRVTEAGYKLTLTPKSKSPFKKLVLEINPEDALVTAVDLFSKSGNRSRYDLSNARTNRAVDSSEFVFKKSGVKEVPSLAESSDL
jgi:outer membrane lipoprotein carrier protein